MNEQKYMTVKEMWKYAIFQAKAYRIIPVVLILGALTGASVAYINSFLYARILDELVAQRFRQAAHFVVILVIALFVVELISKAANRIYTHYTEPGSDEVKKRTAQKAYSMEFEEIEKEETLLSFRRVRQGENGSGNIVEQMNRIYLFFTAFAEAMFACVFVAYLFSRTDIRREGLLSFLISTAILAAAFIGILKVGRNVFERLGKINYNMSLENEKDNAETSYLHNTINSECYGQDIRMYDLTDYFCSKYMVIFRVADLFYEFGKTWGKLNGMMAFFLELLGGIAYSYVALKALAGSVSVGDVLMYAGAIITMMTAIRKMMGLRIDISYSNEYLKTYEEFIRLPNMHYDGTLPIEKRTDHAYRLSMEHVSFRYPGTDDYIIKDLSLTFQIGEKLALVGRNGAGKTTLIKLLLRFYEPTEGRILLNGIDIGKYDMDEYMQIFSVVFQDFRLYHLPLDENIAGSEQADEARVRQVLDQVGLTERVNRMHDGIHTRLYHETGDGESVSGGEAQKIAIARAIYKDASFVILDEPTSALDPLAEAEIYENFNELVGEKTAIYISHRMSSCKFCDKILVLEQGNIAESGTHEELMERQGSYYALYQAQAKHYEKS